MRKTVRCIHRDEEGNRCINEPYATHRLCEYHRRICACGNEKNPMHTRCKICQKAWIGKDHQVTPHAEFKLRRSAVVPVQIQHIASPNRIADSIDQYLREIYG